MALNKRDMILEYVPAAVAVVVPYKLAFFMMSAQWELCQSIVHNRRFVLNGFEKGNFSNNEFSFFLVRRSIRETI